MEILSTLKVYNAIGEEIVAPVNEKKFLGTYEVKFNTTGEDLQPAFDGRIRLAPLITNQKFQMNLPK